MNAQDFPVPLGESLPEAICRALTALPRLGPSPILLVDSPMAAHGLKSRLTMANWPARDLGSPLPRCLSLEQALEDLVDWAGVHAPAHGVPRSKLIRSAELAQALLDFRPIARSLGGSAKAALDLALQWSDLFDGWEWLGRENPCPEAPHLAKDFDILSLLHQQTQTAYDRAAWAKKASAIRGCAPGQEVWFCMGRMPSAKELAMASILFAVPEQSIRVWRLAAVDRDQLTPAALGSFCSGLAAPRELISAHTLEESAWASAQLILDWRNQGIQDIGVLALDRKAVRRLRALLERAAEPFSDASGWALDTTVAASSVFGLLDLLCGRATTQAFLEWIHSPFVIRGLAKREGGDDDDGWLRRIDDALRSYGRVAEISMRTLAEHGLLPKPLANLKSGNDSKRPLPISRLVNELNDAMQACGLDEALSEDAAGQAVIAALNQIKAQAGEDSTSLTPGLWHALLALQMSAARFTEREQQSSVHVCSLQSLLWQRPKALLIVGADAQRLPDRPTAYFFEPERIAEMGLAADPVHAACEFVTQMISLWSEPIPMGFIACSEKPDSQAEFAHVIELLSMARPELVHRLEANKRICSYELSAQAPADQPSPRWQGALPAEISVTDIQSLMQCPYRFYLGRLIGLQPMESLQDEGLTSDTGSFVHAILSAARFGMPDAASWSAWLTDEIERRLSQGLSFESNKRALRIPIPAAVAAKLKADLICLVPALSDWLSQRSALGMAQGTAQGMKQGMKQNEPLTEQSVSRAIQSLGISIKGRIDRWERTDEGAVLIDFKTTSSAELRRQIKAEDGNVQLALYSWMVAQDGPVRDARYVSIRREGIEELDLTVSPGVTLAEQSEQVARDVIGELTKISSGSLIELSGLAKDPSVCERCALRGVCRRDEWIDHHEPE